MIYPVDGLPVTVTAVVLSEVTTELASPLVAIMAGVLVNAVAKL